MPFLARPNQTALFTWQNALRLPWYFVIGERDRDTAQRIAKLVNNLVEDRGDVVCCEYKSRGLESYHEELPRVFDWMESQRRVPLTQVKARWEAKVTRPSDNRFYWVVSEGIPNRPLPAKGSLRPMSFECRMGIGPGNSMSIIHPGTSAQVWLSPEIIDFESRVSISSKGKIFNQFVQPDPRVLLDDLRERGDRQRLYWAKETL